MSLFSRKKKILEDYEVIEKISSWNIDMFAIIVERYEKKLSKYISRITNLEYEEIENSLQEIFIKVYKNINSYNKKYSFSSWIYRIAHNYIIDLNRKKKSEIISIDDEISENIFIKDILTSKDDDIHTIIEKKELGKELNKIVSQLDKKYYNVIVLKYFEELSYDEISDILKIPKSSVWTLIKRWKEKLIDIAKDSKLKDYL